MLCSCLCYENWCWEYGTAEDIISGIDKNLVFINTNSPKTKPNQEPRESATQTNLSDTKMVDIHSRQFSSNLVSAKDKDDARKVKLREPQATDYTINNITDTQTWEKWIFFRSPNFGF